MKVIIKNTPPYDGEYELNLDYLQNQEVRDIKRMSGYTVPEYGPAGDRGDNDLLVAFAFVALTRSGRFLPRVDEDILWRANVGDIDVDVTDEQEAAAEASPPPASEPSATSTPSGEVGNAGSDSPPENAPNSTGSRSSATSATSDQPTLEISRLTS